MAALAASFLTDLDRTEIEQDLALCREVRSQVRCRIRDLRLAGELTVPHEAKLHSQVETLSMWVRRYTEQLA